MVEAFFNSIKRDDAHEGTIQTAFLEENFTVNFCVNGEITAQVYIFTRMVASAALADDDIASFSGLAAEKFYAKSFTVTVAAVIGTTYTFFVCHDTKMFLKLGNLAHANPGIIRQCCQF